MFRINFFHPGASIGRDEPRYPNPEATFIKEVTYRYPSTLKEAELKEDKILELYM